MRRLNGRPQSSDDRFVGGEPEYESDASVFGLHIHAAVDGFGQPGRDVQAETDPLRFRVGTALERQEQFVGVEVRRKVACVAHDHLGDPGKLRPGSLEQPVYQLFQFPATVVGPIVYTSARAWED